MRQRALMFTVLGGGIITSREVKCKAHSIDHSSAVFTLEILLLMLVQWSQYPHFQFLFS